MKDIFKKFLFGIGLIVFAEVFYYVAFPKWTYEFTAGTRVRTDQRSGERYYFEAAGGGHGDRWVKMKE